MSTWIKLSKTPSFGQKGTRDTAVSFAESLLTGKPVGRAARRDTMPKLKPRPRARFGRKMVTFEESADPKRHLGLWVWMTTVLVAVVAISLQVLSA